VALVSPHDPNAIDACIVEGHILELVAQGEPLNTPLDELTREIGLTSEDVRACLRELVQVGWLAVQTQPFGRLTIRLERRTAHADMREASQEHRHPKPNAWPL
jgi:DNA-binding IclR family transcriptional regulator